eukprot:c1337_g1_i1.p1 GENE.c1337_g1_i1~~c1337_g1_i1.p1  ORF type:complete len:582 (+),score=111.68 c1337_g1_i1:34-1746(+)
MSTERLMDGSHEVPLGARERRASWLAQHEVTTDTREDVNEGVILRETYKEVTWGRVVNSDIFSKRMSLTVYLKPISPSRVCAMLLGFAFRPSVMLLPYAFSLLGWSAVFVVLLCTLWACVLHSLIASVIQHCKMSYNEHVCVFEETVSAAFGTFGRYLNYIVTVMRLSASLLVLFSIQHQAVSRALPLNPSRPVLGNHSHFDNQHLLCLTIGFIAWLVALPPSRVTSFLTPIMGFLSLVIGAIWIVVPFVSHRPQNCPAHKFVQVDRLCLSVLISFFVFASPLPYAYTLFRGCSDQPRFVGLQRLVYFAVGAFLIAMSGFAFYQYGKCLTPLSLDVLIASKIQIASAHTCLGTVTAWMVAIVCVPAISNDLYALAGLVTSLVRSIFPCCAKIRSSQGERGDNTSPAFRRRSNIKINDPIGSPSTLATATNTKDSIAGGAGKSAQIQKKWSLPVVVGGEIFQRHYRDESSSEDDAIILSSADPVLMLLVLRGIVALALAVGLSFAAWGVGNLTLCVAIGGATAVLAFVVLPSVTALILEWGTFSIVGCVLGCGWVGLALVAMGWGIYDAAF